MPKRTNISEAMKEAAGSTRARTKTNESPQSISRGSSQPSRVGTKAITGHYPPAVRYQLKLLAAEHGRTMEDMLADALNRLFAAHNKPEIAPTSAIANS